MANELRSRYLLSQTTEPRSLLRAGLVARLTGCSGILMVLWLAVAWALS